MLQQLLNAHNKTAKNHRDKIRTLVSALFDESFDPMLEAIKQDLFGVEDGGRIVPCNHPTLQDLQADAGGGGHGPMVAVPPVIKSQGLVSMVTNFTTAPLQRLDLNTH